LETLNYSVRQTKNSEPVSCGGNVLKAAQNVSRKKASLDETGLEYAVCRHGFAQRGVNMFRGEIFGYAHYYLQKFLMVPKNVEFIWYDVICKYWTWLSSRDPFMANDMKPALSILHGKMHQMSCQIGFGGRWTEGAALTSGEETEQVNSYLSRLSNTTKYMLPQHREDTITEFAMDWNKRKVEKLATSLVKRFKKVESELKKMESCEREDSKLIDEWKFELILYSQTEKATEKNEKEKLIDDIAKIRFEVNMRKASISKLAETSKQRSNLRRKNIKDKDKIEKLETDLKALFLGNDASWKEYIEKRENEITLRTEKKQKVEQEMMFMRSKEEKKLLVEEMKRFLDHYRNKLILLKNETSFYKVVKDKGFKISIFTEKELECLRKKTIFFCTQKIGEAVELFRRVINGESLDEYLEDDEETFDGAQNILIESDQSSEDDEI